MSNKLLSIIFAYFALVNAEGVVENIIRDDLRIVVSKPAQGKRWIETKKGGSGKNRYAGKGYKYDDEMKAFVPKKPFASWTMDTEKATWKAPKEKPKDKNGYKWDEETNSWKVFELSKIKIK